MRARNPRLPLLGILVLLLLTVGACTQPTPPPVAPSPTLGTPPLPATAIPPPATVAAPPSYDERVESVTLASQVLGVPKTFYVYTPPGYAEEPTRRYPVLYLFRGHEREWLNGREDSSRRGKNVIDVYEELLAAGTVGPMLLVFPGISSTDNAVSGMLMNLDEAERATTHEGIGTGRFEDYLLQELIPHVDATYRTIASREGRGVDGFSLGGFMSTKIAIQHPDLFRTAGAFDGLYFYADEACNVDADQDAVLDLPLFAPAFGAPPDTEVVERNNAPTLLCQSDAATVQSISWFIQYGPETAEPDNSNFYRGEHLVAQLEAKGATNGVEPVLTGGHRWTIADEHMRQTLPLHWAILGAE